MANRRPQAPKRRNFVAKHAGKFNRAQTHRDRTKYDRYEDFLKDQLDDYVNDENDDLDEEAEAQRKEEFKAKLAGEKFDPDMREEYEDWLGANSDYLDDETWNSHGLDDDDGYDYIYDDDKYDY